MRGKFYHYKIESLRDQHCLNNKYLTNMIKRSSLLDFVVSKEEKCFMRLSPGEDGTADFASAW